MTSHSDHMLVTHRNLRAVLQWATEFSSRAEEAGRRVLWAPAHALIGTVSLRAWIMDRAATMLGESAPLDSTLLLSGAADVIIIADPGRADPASLHWLAELLSCSEEVSDLAATPPLPQLVLLVPARANSDSALSTILAKLTALGCTEVRLDADAEDAGDVLGLLASLRFDNDDLLAALALAPVPLSIDDLYALVRASNNASLPVERLLSSPLLHVAGNLVLPSTADLCSTLRSELPPECLPRGAVLMLPLMESRYPLLADARVELAVRSGDMRLAVKLAGRQFEEHLTHERPQEALRLVDLCRSLGIVLEQGDFAVEADEARLACLSAQAGRIETASHLIRRMSRQRELYSAGNVIEWLAIGARHLALYAGFEPKIADSLLRRAIRLAGDDVDRHVRLTLLRVSLLSSDVMRLPDRAGWLLTHLNNQILGGVKPATLAQFLEDTATRMWGQGDVRNAQRRLRKLIAMTLPDRQASRGLLLMARCRAHVEDHDAGRRLGQASLHHALRATDIDLVRSAARFLRESTSRSGPGLLRVAASARGREAPRLPVLPDLPAPLLAEAAQVFDVLQSRFGATRWARRRGTRSLSFGTSTAAHGAGSVFEEAEGGWRRLAASDVSTPIRTLTLLRVDGSDLVVFSAIGDIEAREDAMVRLLLSDREPVPAGPVGEPPRRRAVVDDYYRRALAQGQQGALHGTMETLFNKDLLLYFEEQGLSKDDVAAHLGVSRATLYRMYARAGLNV